MTRRVVFYVSDGTGISAQTIGQALLSQFDELSSDVQLCPFVDTREKTEAIAQRIAEARRQTGERPIVVSTLVDTALAELLRREAAFHVDLFRDYLAPLEQELGLQSAHRVGGSHGQADSSGYLRRMGAVNYAMTHDDGVLPQGFAQADVILIGVSRSGKTPTSLYLALHYGLFTANYPLVKEDFDKGSLPSWLLAHRARLFGLTIDARRLHAIRNERRPGASYAALSNCQQELRVARRMMETAHVPVLDSTHKSVEELATAIVQQMQPSPSYI